MTTNPDQVTAQNQHPPDEPLDWGSDEPDRDPRYESIWDDDSTSPLLAFTPVVDETLLRSTTDATIWAAEFKKIRPEIDEGLMIGWFANAIETARAEGLRDSTRRTVIEP